MMMVWGIIGGNRAEVVGGEEEGEERGQGRRKKGGQTLQLFKKSLSKPLILTYLNSCPPWG